MAQTKEGIKKAVATMRKKYGDDYFKKMGAKGGAKGTTGGFASKKVGADGLTGIERSSLVGAKGGRISRRGKSKKKVDSN